ncbi:MAG: membrane protease YdiL (CAAX protease family) [Chlamydiales bacterium]|jgi:membrane protease YdiL (CAAX protease family)
MTISSYPTISNPSSETRLTKREDCHPHSDLIKKVAKTALFVALGVLSSCVVGKLAYTVAMSAVKKVGPQKVKSQMTGSYKFITKNPLLFKAVAYIAAVEEELIFRGLLQDLMNDCIPNVIKKMNCSDKTAKTISSVVIPILNGTLFGLAHAFNYTSLTAAIPQVLATTILGIGLSALKQSSGSLVPPLVAHLCYNHMAITGAFGR